MQCRPTPGGPSGNSRVFEDRVDSSAKAKRPGLNAALNQSRVDDALPVRKLDRLGRQMTYLLKGVADLATCGAPVAQDAVDGTAGHVRHDSMLPEICSICRVIC